MLNMTAVVIVASEKRKYFETKYISHKFKFDYNYILAYITF